MGSVDYIDAVDAALDRLRTTGFYIGDFFANHGPMAAEALAKLGYCDEVDGWVDANIAHRDHRPCPNPASPSTIGGWRWAIAIAAATGCSSFATNWLRRRGAMCCGYGGRSCYRVASGH